MAPDIQTIFFDADGTLRTVVDDPLSAPYADQGLMRLIQTRESHEALFSRLEERWSAYQRQAEETGLELSEAELWARRMLPEYEPNMVCANAPRLGALWREHSGRRGPRPGAAALVKELSGRGYRLGIVSDTASEMEIPDWLVSDGIAQCFHTTLLSCKIRLRKPDPEVFRLAARCAGTPPAACAYVGDRPRDLDGAGEAGFGIRVLLGAPGSWDGGPSVPSLEDLSALFPGMDQART